MSVVFLFISCRGIRYRDGYFDCYQPMGHFTTMLYKFVFTVRRREIRMKNRTDKEEGAKRSESFPHINPWVHHERSSTDLHRFDLGMQALLYTGSISIGPTFRANVSLYTRELSHLFLLRLCLMCSDLNQYINKNTVMVSYKTHLPRISLSRRTRVGASSMLITHAILWKNLKAPRVLRLSPGPLQRQWRCRVRRPLVSTEV